MLGTGVIDFLFSRVSIFPVQGRSNNSDLLTTVREDYSTTVQASLAKSTDVNAKTKGSWTALIIAAKEGHTAVVQALLDEEGADVNARSMSSWTVLMIAAREGHTAIVQLLLDEGADVNAGDNNAVTALMLAEYEGYAEIVKLLKKAGDRCSRTENNKFQSFNDNRRQIFEQKVLA